MKKKLKLTLYTKDHEKLFCVIADKKNCEHLSYKGLFCTISPPKSLKDRSLHSEYKQRPLFFTFVVNPKKLKNNSFSCFHFYVYNCRLIGLISTTPPSLSIHTLSYSLCVVWLQKWAFSPLHPVKRLWMAILLFHVPLPPFTSYLTTVYSIRWGKPLWQQSNSNQYSQNSSILSLHSISYHHKIHRNTAVEILFFDNDR